MYSMFGNRYVCESTFSTMKQVTSKNRNRITNETLDDSLLILAATNTLALLTMMTEKPEWISKFLQEIDFT